ncbi:SDR family NAD(P)-dependent oxidoreductase [Streptomyces sp. NPDC050535]|uniref:SDR family NAD(P)-dependent oxidoreductase n=1 Tax=Streptomyces sp. NPDC050535 TaxID=3365626 RepID=UPI0037AA21DD
MSLDSRGGNGIEVVHRGSEAAGPVDVLRRFRLDQRTAIVTGASSGLGRRFARVLADAGADVYAAARRVDRLEELSAADHRIRAVRCDVADETDRRRLVECAVSETGRVDILVNNAGVAGPPLAENEEIEDFAAALDVNVLAAFHLSKLVGKHMCAARVGNIVNVASILGTVSGAPFGGAGYGASKGALIALTRELAGQWGSMSVRVNALAPGWFRTEMTASVFANAEASAWVTEKTMLNRAGDEGELDGALLFLASDAASYCTGQVLTVDGGWTAQ